MSVAETIVAAAPPTVTVGVEPKWLPVTVTAIAGEANCGETAVRSAACRVTPDRPARGSLGALAAGGDERAENEKERRLHRVLTGDTSPRV